MSPYLLNSSPFDLPRALSILEKHFGLDLEPGDHHLSSTVVPREVRRLMQSPYFRPWRSKGARKDISSTVCQGKKRFQANLDVQQFRPEEILVKVADNTVTVEGKHDEREDEHGYISRHFVRKYVLPEGHDMDKVESRLSSDGVLTLTAPKLEPEKEEARIIPIIQTGEPSKPIDKENKK